MTLATNSISEPLQITDNRAVAMLSWRGLRRLLQTNPLLGLGLVLFAAILIASLGADLLSPHDPYLQSLSQRLLAPGDQHWFGTDQLGRDIFSRVLHGGRISLLIVLLAALLVAPTGLLIGMCAGYFGGTTERLLMRITDIFMAFPRLLLALALAAALGAGVENAVLAIAISAWPPYARQARSEVLSLRKKDYVLASRMAGASNIRILIQHLLPLCVTSALVRITMDLSGIILIAAGLGFLGLGAQPPAAEWGAMVASGRQYLFSSWWVSAMPGIAIFLISLSFNLIGDGLRNALDPKVKA